MAMKTEYDAPAPFDYEVWQPDPDWDCSPELQPIERDTLINLAQYVVGRHKQNWSNCVRQRLSRLIIPLRAALKWMNAASTTTNSAIHDIILEMHRLEKNYWSWTQDDWLEVLCCSEEVFRKKYGSCGNCRQYVLAIAWLLCGFNRLEAAGCFYHYRLSVKVFGRPATEAAVNKLQENMQRLGFVAADNNIRNALLLSMLCQRQVDPEKLELETLKRVITYGPVYMRRSAATLSRIFAAMGLFPAGIDHRILERRRPHGEYRATSNVPEEWLRWCERWRKTAIKAPSSELSTWYRILQCGRWLKATHPDIHSPADWSRDIALEYVAAVCQMKIGQWSEPRHMYQNRIGQLMTASARAGILQAIRVFFRDLQEWGLIIVRFDPVRTFRLPRAIRASIGPAPRVVADDIWSKLVWAGLNLQEQDLHYGEQLYYRYPFSMVRALCVLWLFGGLRRDEILRMRTGCIRWQNDEHQGGSRICLLDVPVNKTSTAFTKPVDPIVGEYIDCWEKERNIQPDQLDLKTGELVSYLFMHKAARISQSYINKSLIPMLCRKAGVPNEDIRGTITSHRARATIASQLFNAREPLGLFELQHWLGHSSPSSTQHYIDITPTKLAGSLSKAGYFERNRRMVSVLIDQDAISSGQMQKGEPWRYYDLGHGLCSYDFFEQCPHRMACAKCSFYLPKSSSEAQYIEGRQNLLKMMQEIPLTDDEQAAVNNDIGAIDKLLKKLKNIETPDKQRR
ncbi:tyrosine-type recombinase/integrase [Salmonella enterica subsp. enterica serovar Newport]|nr:site-specific integrase [Salmonella enterica]ECM3101584.1 tyrosine-type recombinase/integrase [Salmonella enterica subsp. enterica serovar Newport]ECZ3955480.1 tyrosine-type recombinase/integrase [Salmonella enterica]